MISRPMPASRGNPGVTWTRAVFKAVVTCEALLAFMQPILIGGFLQGHYPLLALHRYDASLVLLAALLMTIAAIPQWRVTGGPAWPIFASAGLFAVIVVQVILGRTRILAVHVPLGVSIITADVLLLIWAWRPHDDTRRTAPEDDDGTCDKSNARVGNAR